MNLQPPEKIDRRDDGLLSVHSIFYTIQGEGPFAGTPAVFIRLAGCNLQCPGCDTEYSNRRIEWSSVLTADIAGDEFAGRGGAKPLVVITGGEPFRQNITELIIILVNKGYFVQIETNGTLPCKEYIFTRDIAARNGAYIVVSPKAGKVHPTIWKEACAVKYVMHEDSVDPEDGLPILALNHTASPRVARPPKGWIRPTYLQSMDVPGDPSNNEASLRACIKSCMKFGYILCLQTHKIIGVD